MIYRLLRKIITLALFFFFKKIVVSGKENRLNEGPLIIVANHPNTLMDPLIIASLMKQQIGFLANAGIFVNAILARVLRYFHVIPVFRKKDIAPGDKPDNKFSFLKCHEYLDEKGTILIFPEGESYYELKLREIKTGTARIALSYESLKGLDDRLKILPIALDYSDSIQFRSMVSITIGEPISLQKYKESFLEKEISAVLKLTAIIRQELERHIPNTTNKEQEQFLLKSHKFYTTFNDPKGDLHLNPKHSLASRAQISKTLNSLRDSDLKLYVNTEIKVHLFFDHLKYEGLSPGFFTNKFFNKSSGLVLMGYFLEFLLLAPFYLFGLLTNYIPYILPALVFKVLKLDIEYKTVVQMIVGLFTFPLCYWLEIKLVGSYFSINLWVTCLLLFSFVISAYIAMYYWTEVKRFRRVLHFYFFMKPEKKVSIINLRDEILSNIEIATSKNIDIQL
jgi:glycerol-3-phosphate O-acyltransferase/dihydroxyacetone phosphate acyltransferase